jgi:hypothetical protein
MRTVPAIREANLRLLGRPETTGTVAGDPDKPIRIVVESISSRRREQLADVRPPDAHSSSSHNKLLRTQPHTWRGELIRPFRR